MKLTEIAALAGVSKTTVSYVINGKAEQYRVSKKTIEKVLKVIDDHNYVPNQTASSLRLGKTNTIGFVIPDLENHSYIRIAKYVEQLAKEKGYQIFISSSEDDINIEKQCLINFKQRNVDAIIVATSNSELDEFYCAWDNQAIPIYTLDRTLPSSHFFGLSGNDFEDAKSLSSKMVKELPKQAHIIYCGAHSDLVMSVARESGFKGGLKYKSYDVTYLYAKDYSRERAKALFNDYFEEMNNDLPEAIYITSFSLLQGFIDSVLERKLTIPSEFVIATFGDNEFLDLLPCKVITLSQQHHKIASLIFSNLLNNLLGKKPYEPMHYAVSRISHYRGSFK